MLKYAKLMKNIKFLQKIHLRLLILIVIYSIILASSMWAAWQLRFDFNIPEMSMPIVWYSICWIVPLKLLIFAFTSQYAGLLSYFGVRDLIKLFLGLTGASLLIGILWLLISNNEFIPPRGVILIDYVIAIMGISSIRLIVRLKRENKRKNGSNFNNFKEIGIVGAGYTGANLVKNLSELRSINKIPIYFFDDDLTKINSQLHGIPIIGKPEILLDDDFKHNLKELIIALPSQCGRRIKEVINIANQAAIPCKIIPSTADLTAGRVQVSKLRKVEIQDLLQRDSVVLEMDNIRNLIENKIVLITGGGGSIGSELCRQVLSYGPRRLLIVEQCEISMFEIQQELFDMGYENIFDSLIADILDSDRMESIFQRYSPDLVFHAAAHKHVSLMESQPSEAIRNNTLGTICVADLSIRYSVKQFLMVSTDKAINPTSVMGASKRLAELYIQCLSANQTITKFQAVRFGNVLGSSGSVVPIFERQIEEGGPVTVTHPEVTRYFMTIPEAVSLILQSASQANGGEIFVLDMGMPVKIVDMARNLIELHGFKSGDDIEIVFTGLKPGEKLYEELSLQAESLEKTDHPKIMRFITKLDAPNELRENIMGIKNSLNGMEPDQIKIKLKEHIPEYTPFLN